MANNGDVICISSDDDNDDVLPQKYNKDRKVPRIKSDKGNSSLNSEDVIIVIEDGFVFEQYNKNRKVQRNKSEKGNSSLNREDIINVDDDCDQPNNEVEPTWIRTKKRVSSGSSAKSLNGNDVKNEILNQSKNIDSPKSEKIPESISNERDSLNKITKSVDLTKKNLSENLEKSISSNSDSYNGQTLEKVINGFTNKDGPSITQSPIFKTGEVSISKRINETAIDKMVSIPMKKIKLAEGSSKLLMNNGASSSKSSSSKLSTPSVSNDNSTHSTNDRDSPTPGCSWYSEVNKPTLVIQKRKVLYDDEFDLFSTFIQTCLRRDETNDMKQIVKKLKTKHEKLHPTFLNSDNFKQLLIDKQKMISNNEGQLFVHIQDVNDEMKQGARRSRSIEKEARKPIEVSKKDNAQNGDKGQKEKKEENELDRNEENRIQKKLNVILNGIEICKKRIKHLEEEEVDLDDDHESSYLIVDKYKRKLMQLWNAYCKYSGEKLDAGRTYLRPKHISATMITQVDRAIMSFINSKISKRNELIAKGKSIADTIIFPDYLDILNCIAKCNEKYNLELSKTTQEIKAKEAFIKIGEHLQRVRQTDYWDTFSLYLEEEDDDPALKDEALAEKLANNFSKGKKNMADILEVYTQKQESGGQESKENDDVEIDVDDEDDDADEDEKEEEEDEDEIDIDESEGENEEEDEEKDDQNDDDDHEMTPEIETRPHDISTPSKDNTSKENESRDSPKPSTKDLSNAEHDANLPENNSSEAKDSSAKDMDVIEVVDETPSNSNKQPLLRLRSFAKPPTSWDDSLQSEGSPIKGSKFATSTPKSIDTKAPKVSSGPTLVDLTEVSQKGETLLKPGIRRLDPAYVSALKGKFKTVVVPSNFKGKQIISVKNITNNYNVVNAPGNSGVKSGSKTYIRLPGQSSSHISPRKPVQMRVNEVPADVQRKIIDKSSFKNTQIFPKRGLKPVYYQPTANPNVFTNQEGQTVRLKSYVPNPEAKMMKVLKVNESRKVSITPLQKHRMVKKVLMTPVGNQSNNSLAPNRIPIAAKVDHQYSKKIVNNIVQIMKPAPAPGEQNYKNTLSNRPMNN